VAFIGSELEIIAVPNLITLINHLKHNTEIERPKFSLNNASVPNNGRDLRDVKGQEQAKRALEIAMAGGHNFIMIGAPGSGKSMLAVRAVDLLPPLDVAEVLEVSIIQSVAGMAKEAMLSSMHPFRSPHHSASVPSIVGGGRFAKPGEITLAHNGVLFLDEFAEFPSTVLEALRQPMETGEITIARAESHITYPAKFQLIAAMNPCKCGYFGDKKRECMQAPACVEKYFSKISGPIMERIDIQVYIKSHESFIGNNVAGDGESTETVAIRIKAARDIQKTRYKESFARLNRDLSTQELEAFCKLDEQCLAILSKAQERLNLSMREYHKTLRVARTIADLESSTQIQPHHLAEALSFRVRIS
jgi:magnesium chelatase family protein